MFNNNIANDWIQTRGLWDQRRTVTTVQSLAILFLNVFLCPIAARNKKVKMQTVFLQSWTLTLKPDMGENNN